MRDNELQAPLIAPEIDVRDMQRMMLDIPRLLGSELAAMATGDEFKAAFLLWIAAFHQVPAGSIPNSDSWMAINSRAGTKWPEVRMMATRGFVLCRDNRLYHPVVCDMAKDAWGRLTDRLHKRSQGRARQARYRTRNASVTRDESVTNPGTETPASPPFPPSHTLPPISPPTPLKSTRGVTNANVSVTSQDLLKLTDEERRYQIFGVGLDLLIAQNHPGGEPGARKWLGKLIGDYGTFPVLLGVTRALDRNTDKAAHYIAGTARRITAEAEKHGGFDSRNYQAGATETGALDWLDEDNRKVP